ncbi:MAG TPA: hypothetical protein VH137_05330 [Gemmatimonadales bacterium]|jgi:hypothetical protein|nr:hypothetical protein [Gemmatimonadales bacterium]
MMLERGLYAGGAALLVAGLGLRLASTAPPHAEAALVAVPSTALPDSGPADVSPGPSYAAIIGANIFSPGRTAPQGRFAPPGRAAPTRRRGAGLRLYGITVAPQGAVAIIGADPRVASGALYRLGDLVAGARLVAITDSSVTLAEPSGPLVLHLQPRPPRKP